MPNNFVYTDNTPRANVNPSQDVTNMTQNTNSIDQLIAIDHISFNTNGSGIHKQVTLQNEGAPGLGDGASVLFANIQAGQSWPFWQNGLGTLQLFGNNNPTAATNGWTWILGPANAPIGIQWGSNTAVAHGSFASGAADGTVNFNTNFANACFFALAVPFYNSGAATPNSAGSVNIDTANIGTTSFNWKFNSNSHQYTGFYWIAIGN